MKTFLFVLSMIFMILAVVQGALGHYDAATYLLLFSWYTRWQMTGPQP